MNVENLLHILTVIEITASIIIIKDLDDETAFARSKNLTSAKSNDLRSCLFDF